MRRFTDSEGVEWTVVVGRASYGEMSLLFTPRGQIAVFSVGLSAATAAEGHDLLRTLDDDALRAHLADARLWDDAHGSG